MLDSEDEVHGAGEVGPFLAEGQPLLAAEGGELVVLALAAFGRKPPLGSEEAAFFEAVEGRVERTFLGEQTAGAACSIALAIS